MLNHRLINTKVAGGGGGCTDIVDNYDPFGDSSGVALYQLNGNANDVSTNYNAISVNNVSWGTPGVFSTAALFQNDASAIMLPNNLLSTDHTVSIWFKREATATYQTIVEFDYSNRILFRVYNPVDNLNVFIGNSGYFDHNYNFEVGQWYHLCITFENGVAYRVYVNGQEILSGVSSTLANNNDNPLGAANSSGGGGFAGLIDQTRIFNRALDPLEVEALYTEELCICDGTVDTLDILGDGSCIATYQLDGNANDLSGNYSGTPTDVSYGVGEFDLAGVFNGSSSYISVPNSAGNNLSTISFSLWFKTSGQGGTGVLINNGGADSISTGFFLGLTSSGFIRFSSSGSGGNSPNVDGTINYADNVWHNVVLTYTAVGVGTSIYNVYVDGNTTPIISGTNGRFTGTSSQPLIIGRFARVAIEYFNGSIDQVRIFNKALNSTEVTTLYNETACTVTYSNTEWGGAWDTVNSITSACAGGSSTLSFSNSNRTATKSGSGFYVGAFSENQYGTFYLFGSDAGGLTTKFTGNFTDDTFIYRPILEEGYYAEILMEAPDCVFGVTKNRVCPAPDQSAWYDNAIQYRNWTGQILRYNTVVATTATYTVGDIIGILLDDVAQTVTFYKNGAFIYTVNL